MGFSSHIYCANCCCKQKLRLRGLLFGVILVYSVVLLSPFSLTSLVSLHVAVHEEYHRPAGAGGVGTEATVIVAGGDALFDSPGDRFPIRRFMQTEIFALWTHFWTHFIIFDKLSKKQIVRKVHENAKKTRKLAFSGL